MKSAGLPVNRASGPERVRGMSKPAGRDRPASRVLDLVDEVGPTGAPAGFAPPLVATFEEFYRLEFPRLRVLSRALVGPALADDVAQEAMVAAYGRWSTVSELDSPRGWVRRVCVNKAVSVGRRRAVEQRVLGRLALARTAQGAEDRDDRFWVLVRRLPARQAQAVALFYALDLPVAEVAATLRCSEGSVKVHLSRARGALAAYLSEEADEA